MYNVSSSPFHLNGLQINLLISGIASFLLFAGWWIVADIEVHQVLNEHSTYYVPAVAGTFAYFFANIVPAHYFYDSFTFQQGCFTPGIARTYLFFWLVISFGCLIGSFYILFNEFILMSGRSQWPGYGICLQNACIFTSNMLLRFGKKHNHFY